MANLKKLVLKNCTKLENSNRTIEDIYNIIFSHSDNIMAEYNRGNGPEQWSYAQAQRKIEKLSSAIHRLTGYTDKYIGLYAENCVEWLILFWAILRSGNKPYLINLRQPVGFSKGIIDTLDVKLVLYREQIVPFGIEAVSYSELDKIDAGEPKESIVFGNEFAISTNGTTLKEKICIYSGRELCEQILNVRQIADVNLGLIECYRGKIKALAFLPLYHIFGFEAMYLWYAFWGSTFVFLNNLAPETILHTIKRYEVTHIFAVPLLWNSLDKTLRRTISAQDEKTQKKFAAATKLSMKLQSVLPRFGTAVAKLLLKDVRYRLLGDSVRFCISGGSAIKESTLELVNSLGYPLYNGYGMSEIGITSVELSRNVKDRIKGSIGAPFSSVEYRIGEDSKLFVRGKSLCKSIIINGEESDRGDWFDTGDIMRTDKRGCYYISGRISDIVFGDDGENLNPDFSEDAFVLPEALNLSVLGNEDNSRLMLVVQLPSDMTYEERQKMFTSIIACNDKLSHTYQVREFKYTYEPIMDELSIKVSRAYLKKAIAEGRVILRDFSEKDNTKAQDNSDVRNILRELFAKVLSKDIGEITDTGHFMNDLGGSSLDYFTLVSEIDRRFGITLGFDNEHFGYSIIDFEKIIKELIK